MKKYIIIIAVLTALVSKTVFASVTVTPTTIGSGAEASINIMTGGVDSQLFLFDESGNNVSGDIPNSDSGCQNSPINYFNHNLSAEAWNIDTSASGYPSGVYINFPVGLSAGTYTVLRISCSGSNYNTACGIGGTLSACIASFGGDTTTEIITGGVGGSTSTTILITNLNSPTDIFSFIMGDCIYALISFVILGIFVMLIKRI